MLIRSLLARRVLGVNASVNAALSPMALWSMRRGRVDVGEGSILHCRFSFDRPAAQFRIGERCYIGKSHLVSASSVWIGDDVVISWGVTIVDHDSHSLNWEARKTDILNWGKGVKDWSDVSIADVRIGSRTWIGFNAIVLKGVTLGDGCVVGAGSVVTKSFAPNTIIAGNPARAIRMVE